MANKKVYVPCLRNRWLHFPNWYLQDDSNYNPYCGDIKYMKLKKKCVHVFSALIKFASW